MKQRKIETAKNSQLTLTRVEYNAKLLALLNKVLVKCPDLRFNQALIGVFLLPDVDSFNEEPEVTYKRVLSKCKDLFGELDE